MLNKIKNNNSGFTLPELMVALAILITVTYISMDYLVLAFRAARFSDEQQEAVRVARDSMDLIVKEIRGANASELGGYPLSVVEDDNLVFFSDVDDDGDFEKIEYYQTGTSLIRVLSEPGPLGDYSIGDSAAIVATYMNNESEPIFQYFDEQYLETDVINRIRLIKIILKINVTPSIAPNDVYVESDVNLRNLKNNL